MKTTNMELKWKIKPWTAHFILLLGMILFLTACASNTKVKEKDAATMRDEWTKAVSKVVKDPERAEKLIALGVQYEEGTHVLVSEIENINREIMAIIRNYDSTRDDYERAWGKFTEKKNEALRQYLEALFAMREQVTPEEWKAIMQ